MRNRGEVRKEKKRRRPLLAFGVWRLAFEVRSSEFGRPQAPLVSATPPAYLKAAARSQTPNAKLQTPKFGYDRENPRGCRPEKQADPA
jgi:hypothetical protein